MTSGTNGGMQSIAPIVCNSRQYAAKPRCAAEWNVKFSFP